MTSNHDRWRDRKSQLQTLLGIGEDDEDERLGVILDERLGQADPVGATPAFLFRLPLVSNFMHRESRAGGEFDV